MDATRVAHLASRQESDAPSTSGMIKTGDPQVDTLLDLIANGFQTTIGTTAFLAAVASSLGITLAIIVLFCFLRPLNNVVYAPRAKYADSKHVPPPVAKHPLGWLTPVLRTREADLVDKLGMDATIFLRFSRMSRNMFLVLAVVGCGILIPVNILGGKQMTSSFTDIQFLTRLTPQYMYESPYFWAYVVCAYLFDIIICYFLWHNYRAVVRLRRAYFQSSEYQNSLAARSLLIREIPVDYRSNEGVQRITEETCNTEDVPRAAIARNVKELPELVTEYERTVEELEAVLAKYLKDPNKMPAERPTCKMSKKDAAFQKGKKVDAIEYLTGRVKQLERQVKEVRQSIDTRNAMNYGFASYQQISDAHAVAYAGRKRGAQNTLMRLAPRPQDLIWKNLPMTRKERSWANFVNNLWVALLTVFWIAPNVLSAVFLSNLSHLGQVWPAFQRSLSANPTVWGIVQGIAAPAIQSLFYFFLPAIFRRLSSNAGDITKTSRERHVVHKLFAFFVFNNLFIYSLFSALWAYGVAVIAAAKQGDNAFDALKKGDLFRLVMLSLESMSTFWLTWLLQRNLGAAVDLAQLVNLAWGSFSRRFLSPTPRQLIKLSAPQPFDYAGYYNYFLFYMTVALCYAPLQPLALPVTALYFWLDSHMKKYLIMYVFITKTESGGKFWRVLFNRIIFNALFGNLVIALIVVAQGDSWIMLAALAPLPFLMLGFKYYCARVFDNQIDYYSTSTNSERDMGNGSREPKTKGTEKVGVRFGHPVLYKPLITPMVHAKAQSVLRQIYTGRTSLDMDDAHTVSGYSDMYMNPMSQSQPGKSQKLNAPFELVSESELDFEHFKNRQDFRADAGGDGDLYGRSPDTLRRGSEQSTLNDLMMYGGGSRPDSREGSTSRPGSRSDSLASDRTKVDPGMAYPAGYHQPVRAGSALRDQNIGSQSADGGSDRPGLNRGRSDWSESSAQLLGGAARMGRSPPPLQIPGSQRSGSQGPTQYRDESIGRRPVPARGQGWGQTGDGYVNVDVNGATPTPGEEGSYDYFRGRR